MRSPNLLLSREWKIQGRPLPGVVVSLGEIPLVVGKTEPIGGVVRGMGVAGTWCGVR